MTLTTTRVTSPLDLSDPSQIEAFERLYFTAFERATHNRLVRWLWDWDVEQRRLRTRVPYGEQRIWGMFDDGGVLTGAVAVNVALRTLQASAYDFALPEHLAAARRRGELCEFLTLFSVHEPTMRRMAALWREVFADLRDLGFTSAVATTAPPVMPLYRWAGAECVQQAEIEGEVRFFLSFDLFRSRRIVRK